MDSLALRVVARYQRAMAIGNPEDLVRKYDALVTHLAEFEPILPRMREAEKIVAVTTDAQWAASKGMVNPEQAAEIKFYFANISEIRYKVKFSLDAMKRIDADDLFLSILQQYNNLPPKTRKGVEEAARYFAKTRILAPKNPEAINAYEKMLKTFRAFSVTAHDAIAHGKGVHQTEAEAPLEKTKAGPFTLINTGGFDARVIEEVTKVVETATHLLETHGLSKVCYGDVLISNTVSRKNVLAFYLIEKDEMFIRANLAGKEHDAVKTMCHELGHRLEFKFLESKKRQIEGIYHSIDRKDSQARSDLLDKIWKDPALKPKVGDIMTEGNKEYVVTGFRYGRGYVIELAYKDDPTKKAKIGLEAYATMTGLLPKDRTVPSGFVTAYAKTNANENFAEMIAHWCLGKLPEDQVEMLKSVL